MNPTELKTLADTLNGIANGQPWQEKNPFDESWDDTFSKSCPVSAIFYGRQIRLKPWELGRTVNGHTLPDGASWHRQDFTEDMLPAPYRPLMDGEQRLVGDQFYDSLAADHYEWCDVEPFHACKLDSGGVAFNWCPHRTTRPIPFTLTPEQIADGWIPWSGGECPVEPESKPTVMFRSGSVGSMDLTASDRYWLIKNDTGDIIAYKPDPYGHLRQALADGKAVQIVNSEGNWVSLASPSFSDPIERYRIKPEPQWAPLGPEDVPPGSVINNGSFDAMPWIQVHSVDSGGVNFIWNSQFYYQSYFMMFNEGWQINRPRHRDTDGNPTLWEPCRKLSTV